MPVATPEAIKKYGYDKFLSEVGEDEHKKYWENVPEYRTLFGDQQDKYAPGNMGNAPYQMQGVESVPERGLIGDIGSQFARGAADLTRMAGHALKEFDPEGGIEIADKIGSSMVGLADKAETWDALKPDQSEVTPGAEGGEGYIKKGIMGGLRSSVPSIASAIPGFFVGGPIGAIAAVGVTNLGLFGAGTMGTARQEYLDARDRGEIKATDKEIEKAALRQGIIEGGGEALASMLTFGIFGPSKFLAQPLKTTITELLQTPKKQMLKNLGTTMIGEVLTEMAQEGAQGQVDTDIGMAEEGAWAERAIDAIIPAVTMTLLFSSGAGALNWSKTNKLKKILSNESGQYSQEEREAAMEQIEDGIAAGGKTPEEKAEAQRQAKAWVEMTHAKIANEETIDLHDDFVQFGKMSEDELNSIREASIDNESGELVAALDKRIANIQKLKAPTPRMLENLQRYQIEREEAFQGYQARQAEKAQAAQAKAEEDKYWADAEAGIKAQREGKAEPTRRPIEVIAKEAQGKRQADINRIGQEEEQQQAIEEENLRSPGVRFDEGQVEIDKGIETFRQEKSKNRQSEIEQEQAALGEKFQEEREAKLKDWNPNKRAEDSAEILKRAPNLSEKDIQNKQAQNRAADLEKLNKKYADEEAVKGEDIQELEASALKLMAKQAAESHTKGYNYDQNNDKIFYSASSPQWMRDLNGKLGRKEIDNLIHKYLNQQVVKENGKPKYPISEKQWEKINKYLLPSISKAIESESELQAFNKDADLRQEGFEPMGGQTVIIEELNQGEVFTGRVNGREGTYKVEAKNEGGAVLIDETGKDYELAGFEDVELDGLKRPGKDGKIVFETKDLGFTPPDVDKAEIEKQKKKAEEKQISGIQKEIDGQNLLNANSDKSAELSPEITENAESKDQPVPKAAPVTPVDTLANEALESIGNIADKDNVSKVVSNIAKREGFTQDQAMELYNRVGEVHNERKIEADAKLTPEQRLNNRAGMISNDLAIAIETGDTRGFSEIGRDGTPTGGIKEEEIGDLEDVLFEIEVLEGLNEKGKLTKERFARSRISPFIGFSEIGSFKESLEDGTAGDVLKKVRDNLRERLSETKAEQKQISPTQKDKNPTGGTASATSQEQGSEKTVPDSQIEFDEPKEPVNSGKLKDQWGEIDPDTGEEIKSPPQIETKVEPPNFDNIKDVDHSIPDSPVGRPYSVEEFLNSVKEATSQETLTRYEESIKNGEVWRDTPENKPFIAEVLTAIKDAKTSIGKKPEWGANNKVFTADRATKARELLRKKLSGTTLNAGIDPEIIMAGLELGGYHVEAGARTFAAFSKKMIEDIGEGVKPYLKSFYNAVRDFPAFDNTGMNTYAEVEEILTKENTAKAEDDVKTVEPIKTDKEKIANIVDKEFMAYWKDNIAKTRLAAGSLAKAGFSTKALIDAAKANNHIALVSAIKDIIGEGKKDATTKETTKSPEKQISEWVIDKLKRMEPFTSKMLFDQSDIAYEGTQGEKAYSVKDAYDALELGVNEYILSKEKVFNPHSANPLEAANEVDRLTKIVKTLLPTQTKRTVEQNEYQQFSTPPTLAYIVNWIAKINKADTVLEPSAGVGGLAVFAKKAGATVYVNELSKRRTKFLNELGFDKTFSEDAAQINNILPAEIKPTVIIMNPPFSATAGRTKNNKSMNGAKHIEQALLRLEDGGRLVAITGQGMSMDAASFKSWWSKIKEKYNVRLNIGLDGKDYGKYGTTFDNQLIVIDKKGKTGDIITKGLSSNKVESYEDLIPTLSKLWEEKRYGTNKAADTTDKELQSDGAVKQGGKESAEKVKPSDRSGIDSQPSVDGMGDGTDGSSTNTDIRSDNSKIQASKSSDIDENLKEARGTKQNNEEKPEGDGALPGRGGVGLDAERGTELLGGTKGIQPVKEKAKALTNSVYDVYVPHIKIKGAQTHITPLVESAAMADTAAPKNKYQLKIPQKTIDNGWLTDAQLEAVASAGAAHSKQLPNGETKGFFIGDGTGTGKGREISGIIWDNWLRGSKKAIWFSEKASLLKDAQRDLKGLGWENGANKVFALNKTKIGTKVTQKEGILFTQYATLSGKYDQIRQDSEETLKDLKIRINQITEWAGKDFDGVIAFDEAHNMGNVLPKKGKRGTTKPAKQALAGVLLQELLPKAKIIYVSATGATEVSNLAYAPRLGLWGEGTPFKDVRDFVDKIEGSGVSAMELVARDMKSLGLYIARSLSYADVKYDNIEHKLSPDQVMIYDKIAEGWQVVLNNIDEAIVITEGTNQAKSAALSAFWGAHLRFFNQIITAMQMPSALKRMEQDIKEGHSVVVQLVATGASQAERKIAALEEGQGVEDIDMTPRETLMQFIENSFPVKQYEIYTDENGDEAKRVVVDSNGKPVLNQEAVAMRDRLLQEVGGISVPDTALDMLIKKFGTDMVAEVTGRSRRIVYDKNGRKIIEKFSDAKAQKDIRDFMDDKKRILVFSEKGGTGSSYHAAMDVKNQRLRRHYLIQPGWRADKAVQGLGRSHRSYQKQAPEFILVSTDLPGHKRFLSSIARKLDQLGALTKGQRQTGSQGLFSAKDNLESSYAKDALTRFFNNLTRGVYPNINVDDFQNQTGLKLLNNEGERIEVLPIMTQFLNRLLSLKKDMQEEVFTSFSQELRAVITTHTANGTLDVGLETIQADRVRKVKEEVAYKNLLENVEAKYIQFDLDYKANNVPFERIPNGVSFYVNKHSKKIRVFNNSFYESTDPDTGAIEKIGAFVNPKNNRTDVNESDIEKKWDKVTRKEAKTIWDEEYKALPEYNTEKLHLLTGTLLPLWDRLKGRAFVARVQTDDGQRFLGRKINQRDINDILDNLGMEKEKIEMTSQEIVEAVLSGGSVKLHDGMQFKRSRVNNENRIEYNDTDSSSNALYLEARSLEDKGLFSEIIQYKTRWFIPNNNSAGNIIDALRKGKDIVDVQTPIDGNGQYSITSPTPPGDTLSAASVQEYFRKKNQTVGLNSDGSLWVRLDNGMGFNVELVERFSDAEYQVAISSGKMDKNGQIAGRIVGNNIKLSTKFGNKYTITHETVHLMRNAGILVDRDMQLTNVKMQKDKSFTMGKDQEENYANYLTKITADREVYAGTPLGRIIQKIIDFLDSLYYIGRMSTRKLARQIETGKIYSKPPWVEGKEVSVNGQKIFGVIAPTQNEIRAWHGSPHVIKGGFKDEKIGTGESIAAFGRGHYATNSPDVAKFYAGMGDKRKAVVGESLPIILGSHPKLNMVRDNINSLIDTLRDETVDKNEIEGLRENLENTFADKWVGTPGPIVKEIEKLEAFYNKNLKQTDKIDAAAGRNLYDITIHKGKNPNQYDYLHWYKAVTQSQFKKVSEQLKKEKKGNLKKVKFSAETLYRALTKRLGSTQAATQLLLRAGIDGITYPAGSLSGGEKTKAENYVVFDPKEITINEHIQYQKVLNTDTPAFKKWFGGSKVVDEKGKPLVVYHGTTQDFSSFEAPAYFTTDKNAASKYAGDKTIMGASPRVMPVYLSLTNVAKETDIRKAAKKAGILEAETYEILWDKKVIDSLKANGFDGAYFKDEMDGEFQTYVAFSPAQIKSIYNRGTFDPTNPDIQYSTVENTGEAKTIEELFQQDQALIDKANAIKDKVATKEARESLLSKTITKTLDHLHPIKALGDKAYQMHRVLTGINTSQVAMFLEHGKFSLTGAGDVLTVKERNKGFVPFLDSIGQDWPNLFYWVAAKRAEKLANEPQSRENWINEAERKLIFERVGNKSKSGKTWASLNKEFQAFNKNILDVAEAAGIIDPEGRAMWESDVYLPFYRIFEDEATKQEYLSGPNKSTKHISAQIRRLRGGEAVLGSPVENILKNWMSLLDSSARNKARKEAFKAGEKMGILEEVPKKDLINLIGAQTVTRYAVMKEGNQRATKLYDTKEEAQDFLDSFGDDGFNNLDYGKADQYRIEPRKETIIKFGNMKDKGILSFQVGGKPVYFKSNDPDLFAALEGIDLNKFDNSIMKTMGGAKRLLSYAATFGAPFKIRNLIRDTIHVAVTSKSFMPVIDSAKGFLKAMREDPIYIEYMASGFGFGSSYVHSDTPEIGSHFINKILKKEGKGAVEKILRTPAKMLAFWEKLGAAGENAARVQLYANLKAKGLSNLEAGFQARDLMDFSMRGSADSVQMLTRTIPFLNARVQAFYKLGRAAKEDPKAFAVKSSMLTFGALALWAMYKDDDRYNELEDWDKWTYFHLWLGDDHYRIPKPFEIGALFCSLPETMANVQNDTEEGKMVWEWFKFTAQDIMKVDLPQLVKPILEDKFNKSTFTGRPIIPDYIAKLPPEEQYKPWTPALARVMGDAIGISPLKVQHYIRGYLASIGMGTMMATDSMFRSMAGYPDKPAGVLADYIPLVGDSLSHNTKYMTRFYELFDEMDAVNRTVNHYKKTGRFKEAVEFGNENITKLRLKSAANKVKKELSDLSKKIQRVHENKGLTAERKRMMVKALTKKRNDIAMRGYKAFNK